MEVRYQDHWDATMLADYCWFINSDDAGASHSRKSVKRRLMADDVKFLAFFNNFTLYCKYFDVNPLICIMEFYKKIVLSIYLSLL